MGGNSWFALLGVLKNRGIKKSGFHQANACHSCCLRFFFGAQIKFTRYILSSTHAGPMELVAQKRTLTYIKKGNVMNFILRNNGICLRT